MLEASASASRQIAIAQSYGVFSHLWASVDQLSASSTPAARCALAAMMRRKYEEKARGLRRRNDFGEKVEFAGIHFPRLQAEDRTVIQLRELCRVDPSKVVHGCEFDLCNAEAEQTIEAVDFERQHRIREDVAIEEELVVLEHESEVAPEVRQCECT